MTISLGGSVGPKSEGLTQAGGRPVQQVAPPEPRKRPETAPTPERPEMTLPDPKARTRVREQAPSKNAVEDTTSRTPTRGEQARTGNTSATSQVRGQGFGLSTGGGGLGGVTLDVGNFCCEEYLVQMVAAIKAKWNEKQNLAGTTGMKFTILRDGTITGIQVERPSGLPPLDLESQHALAATQRLAPLPPAYPNSTLTVHLLFDYQR
jgi:TonB family protein